MKSIVTKDSDYGRQYKEYVSPVTGKNANVGAQVLGGELWFN